MSDTVLKQLPVATASQRVQNDTILAGPATHIPCDSGGSEAYAKSSVFSRAGGRKTKRRRANAAVYDKADAECSLIVSLYFDGISLSKVSQMMGRSLDYVSRVFHSPRGRLLVNEKKRSRDSLAEQLQERMAYAAQQSLDNIIALANGAGSEAVKLRANEYVTDKALPAAPRGAVVQVNIGDDAIQLALQALAEIDAAEVNPK